jgi:cell division septation protein DedD
VAGLLIASFAAGYFILSRPKAAQNDNQPRDAESNATSADPAAQGNSTATATGQSSEASADAASAQAAKPSASTEFGAVGSLTLQSAAFPDEAGASEFSNKLIRTGIPAYVVPADLPRKGRWFRVRVGRFSNADDAKRYAVQSRLRAKAAGLDVDFIVVEYGKP